MSIGTLAESGRTLGRQWAGVLGLLAVALACPVAQAQSTTPLTVMAAGSLRGAMTELARRFEQHTGQGVRLVFGPSGMLRDRIVAGEAADVFASANMTHPESLRGSGKALAVEAFARNALCALATPDFALRDATLPKRLLDADVRVATSTPKADPAGDYAFEFFDRVEATGAAGAGSAATLKAKALQLTGGPASPPPPADGSSAYAAALAERRADVFITYCTNAAQARAEQPALQVLEIPSAVNVAATYGIAMLPPGGPVARAFMSFVRSEQGQQVLRQHGFAAP